MKVALAQINVETANPEANLAKAARWVEKAATEKANMIVFPEMWTTGFHWQKNRELATTHAKQLAQLNQLALKHKIWITGSVLFQKEEGHLFNSAILINDQGQEVLHYAKTHLFSLLGEDKQMNAGECFSDTETPWGKIGLAICYDLRFPEMFRHYALNGAKVIILPAAFPHPRLEHWKILLRARAIENQLFMVAVNRVGTEQVGGEKEVEFFGHSCVIDPWGNTVCEAKQEEELITAFLDLNLVDEIRDKMKIFQDRRADLY